MSILTLLIIALAAIVVIGSLVWEYVGLWGPTVVSSAVFVLYTFVAAINNMGVDESDANPTFVNMAWASIIMMMVSLLLFSVCKRLSTPAQLRHTERR